LLRCTPPPRSNTCYTQSVILGLGLGLTCTFTSYEQCMMTGGPGTGGQCVRGTESMVRDEAATTAGSPSGNDTTCDGMPSPAPCFKAQAEEH
jgi:hypothetical protein